MEERLTSRPARWKQILTIAWPLIVANSFWNLQLTVDRIFLGTYSTEALGAAMAVMGVFWTPMALLQQTAGYVTTFVAQYFGAKEFDKIGSAVWQAIYCSIVGGILFLGFLAVSDDIFTFVGHSPSLMAMEKQYFDAICYSALPTALVATFSGFFTGLGATRTVMWINAVGVVVNIVFDYLMIFGKFGFPAMGIAGAGYATALANWGSALFGAFLLFRQKNEVTYKILSAWQWHADLVRRYIRYGLPSGMQWALEGLAFTVFLIFVGRFKDGEAALASSSITVTMMMLAVLPAVGVAQAVMVLVGQHLGNKRPDLAEDASWSGVQVAAMYIMTVGLTFVFFPDFYLGWFQNQDNAALWSQVSATVPYLLMFAAMFTAFDSMNLVFSFALKGAGDTRFVSLVALTVPWPLMVVPTILMREWDGAVFWAWGAASIFGITQALVFWRRFTGGKWKSMSVIGELSQPAA
jgi:MATE family multidrug resistance protein